MAIERQYEPADYRHLWVIVAVISLGFLGAAGAAWLNAATAASSVKQSDELPLEPLKSEFKDSLTLGGVSVVELHVLNGTAHEVVIIQQPRERIIAGIGFISGIQIEKKDGYQTRQAWYPVSRIVRINTVEKVEFGSALMLKLLPNLNNE